MRYLTFALGKGRLAEQTLKLFEKIGITCEEMKDKDSRKLIFVNEPMKLKFFLAKGPDVPTYVEYGAASFAATSVFAVTFPSLPGGVTMTISSTPATFAGTMFISTEDG